MGTHVTHEKGYHLGDFFVFMPVFSWHFKNTGNKVILYLNKNLLNFAGLKELLLMQEFIEDVVLYEKGKSRGWDFLLTKEREGVAWPARLRIEDGLFEYDPDYTLAGPEPAEGYADKFFVVDFHPHGKSKKKPVLDKNKFNKFNNEFIFCDFAKSLIENLSIALGSRGVLTVDTGFAVMADLYKIKQVVYCKYDSPEHLLKTHYFNNTTTALNLGEFDISKFKEIMDAG